jgi:type IV secretion system protein VirD4
MREPIRISYWDRSFRETLAFPKESEAHGVLCGPTRSGKDSTFLLPLLMSYKGSCLVIDPKGQAAAVTGRYRRDVLKQEVCILNPFNILPKYLQSFRHAQFDPLTSCLDPESPEFAADADNLAEGLLPLTNAPDPHWVKSARLLVSGVAMALRALYRGMTLLDVYKVIAGPELFVFCQEVIKADPDGFIVERLAKYAATDASESREVNGIISSALTDLRFIGNQRIADNLRASTIDFSEMTRRPTTVYLILPGKRQHTFGPWFRMIVNAWVDANMSEGRKTVPMLGVLNEFKTSVGDLSIIETLQTLGAGYGIQLLSVFCDIPSIKTLFPKSWETFLGSAGFTAWFAPRLDMTTAQYLSGMSGTIDVPSVSRSAAQGKPPFQLSTSGVGFLVDQINKAIRGDERTQVSISHQSRHYLLPEDVRELGDDELLVFGSGIKGVIRGGRRPYWKCPEFAGKYDPDPYHSA